MAQAETFGGTVAELATGRDEAQIDLMRALDEIGAADSNRDERPSSRPGHRVATLLR